MTQPLTDVYVTCDCVCTLHVDTELALAKLAVVELAMLTVGAADCGAGACRFSRNASSTAA